MPTQLFNTEQLHSIDPVSFKKQLPLLSRCLRPDSIYCDVGAWIGPTVLHASTKCKVVYCFEPDRISYRYLIENLQHNNIHNVIPFNVALTPQNGFIKVGTFAKCFGRSKTSVLKGNDHNALSFPGLSLQTVRQSFNIEKIDLLKIDIEGGEFSLVPSLEGYLKEQHPLLYLSTHPQFLASQEREGQMQHLLNLKTAVGIWILGRKSTFVLGPYVGCGSHGGGGRGLPRRNATTIRLSILRQSAAPS